MVGGMARTKMNPQVGAEAKEKLKEKAKGKAKTKVAEVDTTRPDFFTRFQTQGEKPLTLSPMSVRLPPELDTIVRSLPNRTAWLRDAIIEKLEREGRDAAGNTTEAAAS